MENKLPPQNIEVEGLVLGSIFIDRHIHDKVIPLLVPTMFYDQRNEQIFKAIHELYENNKAVDPVTVTERLKSNEQLEYVGGSYYVISLTHSVGTTTHVLDWCDIIIDKFIKRCIIRLSQEYAALAYDDYNSSQRILDEFQSKALLIGSNSTESNIKSITEILNTVVERSLKAKENKNKLLGIPSGLKEVDRITNGWQNQDLVILAARPAVGKTSMALSFLKKAALDEKVPVGIFSLEMGSTQLGVRFVSGEVGKTNQEINMGKVDEVELLRAKEVFNDAPIYVDDTAGLSIMDLRAKARYMVKNLGVKMIIVDYLQLMSGSKNKGGSREQEISNISRNLKVTAKELDIPVIALGQLSRKCEDRGDKRPMLSDLRESGAIEQDADIVIFLYSDEMYGIMKDEDGNSTEGIIEVIIRKHRNGATGIVKVGFKKETTSFHNLEEKYIEYEEPVF